MPPKRNKENKGLPSRWRFIHGAYYFRVPKGLEDKWGGKKMFRLSANLAEAYKVWSEKIALKDNVRTISKLLERYELEVIPEKAPSTQSDNRDSIGRLRAVFGDMAITDIRPKMIYSYRDKRAAKVRAHREISVLSHVFTKAVEWGYIDRHPFKGEVRLKGEKARTRYVEDWEVIECLSLLPMRKRGSVSAIQYYIRIKLLTGLRRGDLLRLRIASCREDGIRVATSKTKKEIIYEWTEELREAFSLAKTARPIDISPFLFCNKDGQGYLNEKTGKAYGWNSMWQRFMKRVLKETKVTEKFTEHDLRAKCASDAKTLEHARELLAHADSRTTQRFYRRKIEKVRPLR